MSVSAASLAAWSHSAMRSAASTPSTAKGKSIAALQAVSLQQTLGSAEGRLSERYFKASSKIVDIAWNLAIGSDLSLPEVAGKRTILARLFNAWTERMLTAAERDAYVAESFGSVTDLLTPPSVLSRPGLRPADGQK